MTMDVWNQAGVLAKLTLLLGVIPLVMGVAYAIWPSEARLALMRPLSLAGIFSALCGFLGGTINGLISISGTQGAVDFRAATMGIAEALVPLFFGLGCLTVGWLCVALGMRRSVQP
jgi:hypothetical protein